MGGGLFPTPKGKLAARTASPQSDGPQPAPPPGGARREKPPPTQGAGSGCGRSRDAHPPAPDPGRRCWPGARARRRAGWSRARVRGGARAAASSGPGTEGCFSAGPGGSAAAPPTKGLAGRAVVTPERGVGIDRSIEWSSVISYWSWAHRAPGCARRGAVVTTRAPETLPRAPRGRLRAPVSQGGKRVYPCFPLQCWRWTLNPLVYTASLACGAAVRDRFPA